MELWPLDLIAVRVPPMARSFPCLGGAEPLSVGDYCVIESARGHEFAQVTRAEIGNPYRTSESALPRVLRRATREDEESFAHKIAVEGEAREFCLRRIAERGLAMRLGPVERSLDGRKLTFYFTAEGRVDFRELVRDLSGEFRVRVELRQVGARDDSAMHGGCGSCGRSLCCAEWMSGFDPVSIKMAKAQGLSLNPAKISGVCGRLMCCLRFEYEAAAGAGRSESSVPLVGDDRS